MTPTAQAIAAAILEHFPEAAEVNPLELAYLTGVDAMAVANTLAAQGGAIMADVGRRQLERDLAAANVDLLRCMDCG